MAANALSVGGRNSSGAAAVYSSVKPAVSMASSTLWNDGMSPLGPTRFSGSKACRESMRLSSLVGAGVDDSDGEFDVASGPKNPNTVSPGTT